MINSSAYPRKWETEIESRHIVKETLTRLTRLQYHDYWKLGSQCLWFGLMLLIWGKLTAVGNFMSMLQ